MKTLFKRWICDETSKEETMKVERETMKIVDIKTSSNDISITASVVNGKLVRSICISKDKEKVLDYPTYYRVIYITSLDALNDLIKELTKVATIIECELEE